MFITLYWLIYCYTPLVKPHKLDKDKCLFEIKKAVKKYIIMHTFSFFNRNGNEIDEYDWGEMKHELSFFQARNLYKVGISIA